jgi:guanine deaminase
MSAAGKKIFIGPFVHTLAPTTIRHIPCAILGVDANGTIAFVVPDADENNLSDVLDELGWASGPNLVVRRLAHGQFLCPGFIDTHTHGKFLLPDSDHF